MKKKLKIVLEYFLVAVGAILAAFAIETFLVPNTILDGGVVGISMIISNLTGIELGALTVIINIPFLIVGARRLGLTFVVRAVWAIVIFSIFVALFNGWFSMTTDSLLAVCFGGVLLGIGVGFVIKYGACLDGTETVAILINKKFGLSVGTVVLIFNVVIYAAAGFLYGLDRAMYSLLTYFITSRVINMIENGMGGAKAAMIITDNAEAISELIYKRMGRTVTIMEGEGLVSGKKSVLYCVMTITEIVILKGIIDSVDGSAFVAVSDVSEIIGNHIKRSDSGVV